MNADENLGLLGKMAIEGLRGVACDTSDPVDIGPAKARAVSLRCESGGIPKSLMG
jgi:hypothetical protein